MSSSFDSYGFIFDLDGVIVDTANLHYKAWRRLANMFNFDFDAEQNQLLKGVSRDESLEIILSWGGISLSPDEKTYYANLKNTWYQQEISLLSPSDALPGAIDFLRHCKESGIRTSLGSASKNALPVLEKLKIKDLFDAIIDGNVTERGKPDPEVFLKASMAMGIAPAKCVVFEDAAVGIEAALNGNMLAIGIGNTDILQNADVVYPGLYEAEIAKIIKLIDARNKMNNAEKGFE